MRAAWVAAFLAILPRLGLGDEPARQTNSLGMVLVSIPAGEFLMGSPETEARAMAARVTNDWYRDSAPSEWPQRRVRLTKPFQLGAHEVTLGQFRVFVERSGYRTEAERDGRGAAGQRDGRWVEQAPEFNWRQIGYERSDREPVVNVSWNDARAFCAWLSDQEKATYRLPTEAEWEYACRAGRTNTFFWDGGEARRPEYAWTSQNSGGKPHPVGQLQPNPWGLYDILGNAYEYCADGWSTNTALALGQPSGSNLIDPLVPPSPGPDGELIVVRSTSWGTHPLHCRSAFRGSAPKDHRNQRDGFRVVRE